jgi:hypothetical protein
MANVTVQETAAATAVGTDLLANSFFQFDARPRVVSRAGLTGSSAAGNAAVDIFFGTEKIATLRNTTSGAVIPVEAKDMMPIRTNRALLPFEPLRAIVAVASATTIMSLTLEIQEL